MIAIRKTSSRWHFGDKIHDLKKDIEKKLKINLQKKIILVTFHPVTHEIKQLNGRTEIIKGAISQ